jgi:urease accessory protein
MNVTRLASFVISAAASVVVVACAPTIAHAHTGVGPVHDLIHGLAHPLTGLDHICAMVAVGIWAAQRGGRAIGIMPAMFVLVMAIGGALGMAGVTLPYVEPSIVLSVIVLGAFVATAVRLPLAVSLAIVSLFAIVHGYAHGVETPAEVSGVSYTLGFIAATVGLLAAGVGFGRLMQRLHTFQLVRLAGGAIALCGVFLSIR